MGSGVATTSLIEQHDAIVLRIKEPAMIGFATGTRTTMQKQNRNPIRMPDLLNVESMAVINGHHLRFKRFNGWIEVFH
jgi:hypothetical protein